MVAVRTQKKENIYNEKKTKKVKVIML